MKSKIIKKFVITAITQENIEVPHILFVICNLIYKRPKEIRVVPVTQLVAY